MKKELIIFGAGQIAEIAHYYFTHDSDYRVKAFAVDKEFIKEDALCGLPILPFESIEESFSPLEYDFFIAMSYSKINQDRANKAIEAQNKKYKLASYRSTKALISNNVEVGNNCFILEQNNIQPFVSIGNNVFLWSGNHIGHHSIIKDNCFISSHVVLSGGVEVGENTFIGVNSTIRDSIHIGKYNVIGAGSLILQDTSDHAVLIGQATEISKVPSHRLRKI